MIRDSINRKSRIANHDVSSASASRPTRVLRCGSFTASRGTRTAKYLDAAARHLQPRAGAAHARPAYRVDSQSCAAPGAGAGRTHRVRVASHHGCDFCADLGQALAIQRGIGAERFNQLDRWRESSQFTPRECAALAWVDDILDDGKIEDETLEEARKMFSERELVELTWVQASETYFNMQAHPLGIPSDGLAAIARRASP